MTTELQHRRWTHIALPVSDIERSIEWYRKFTPLEIIDRRSSPGEAETVWFGHVDHPEAPFVLVLTQFMEGHRLYQEHVPPTMHPFAHIGIEVPTRAEVDELADLAEAEGCLHRERADLPPPVGYICGVADPDGNVIEFSHDQAVYAKVREVAASRGSERSTSA